VLDDANASGMQTFRIKRLSSRIGIRVDLKNCPQGQNGKSLLAPKPTQVFKIILRCSDICDENSQIRVF